MAPYEAQRCELHFTVATSHLLFVSPRHRSHLIIVPLSNLTPGTSPMATQATKEEPSNPSAAASGAIGTTNDVAQATDRCNVDVHHKSWGRR